MARYSLGCKLLNGKVFSYGKGLNTTFDSTLVEEILPKSTAICKEKWCDQGSHSTTRGPKNNRHQPNKKFRLGQLQWALSTPALWWRRRCSTGRNGCRTFPNCSRGACTACTAPAHSPRRSTACPPRGAGPPPPAHTGRRGTAGPRGVCRDCLIHVPHTALATRRRARRQASARPTSNKPTSQQANKEVAKVSPY